MSNKLAFLVSASLAVSAGAQAQLQFSFAFGDGAGTGFNDPTQGAARQAALISAGNTLASYFPSYNTTIQLSVTSFNDLSGILGWANTATHYSSLGPNPTDVQRKIQTGSDATGLNPDGEIHFNFHYDWGYSGTVSGSSYDFQAVAIHELVHTLGFASFITAAGQGGTLATSGSPDLWSTFDSFLTDQAGAHLIVGDHFNTSLTLDTLTKNPGVYFDGPNAVAAYGGRVPIYSPGTFTAGSSMSHTDGNTFTGANALLMNPSFSTGPQVHTLSTYEQAILADLGYAVVPEPSAVAGCAAFGLLGWAGWRRVRVSRAKSGSGSL